MDVHLIDGTYELYRHYFAVPKRRGRDGVEIAAARGVLSSLLALLEDGATHVGVASDHVVESFRNDLYAGYKTGRGVEPELFAQFHIMEDLLRAAGFAVWAMIDHEADDALATGATIAARDDRVERVHICTPDKDLSQCVEDPRVIQVERRTGTTFDVAGVVKKFGVPPESIPDYLALVGDSADGFPGLPGWGAKSSATVLARFGHIENIPDSPDEWDIKVRSAKRLAETLSAQRDDALLFRRIATVVRDVPGLGTVDDWEWRGPGVDFEVLCDRIDSPVSVRRARRLAVERPQLRAK